MSFFLPYRGGAERRKGKSKERVNKKKDEEIRRTRSSPVRGLQTPADAERSSTIYGRGRGSGRGRHVGRRLHCRGKVFRGFATLPGGLLEGATDGVGPPC